MNAPTPLLILNAGDPHSAEMAEIVERVNRVSPTWDLLGYVSSDPSHAEQMLNGYPVHDEAILARRPDARVVANEYGWHAPAEVPRERYATLVDPSAFVSRTATVGTGCVVFPHCFVGFDARIGDHVFCLSGAVVNHDALIDDRVTLCARATLAGAVRVEPDCYLGQGCQIRQSVRVGRNSLIGMGAVVLRDVDADSVMVGNPARRLRARTPRPPGDGDAPGTTE